MDNYFSSIFNGTEILEPRLSEYMTKKKYYIENHIQPSLPLETEYHITKSDINHIRNYEDNKNDPSHMKKDDIILPTHKPNIQYNQKLHYDRSHKKDNSMQHNPNFKSCIDYLDNKTETDAFFANMTGITKSRRLYSDPPVSECVKKIIDQYNFEQKYDPDMINDMMLGVPSHTKKTYGFNDQFEHSFSYIDGDIQNKDHVVLPFSRGGDSARITNTRQGMTRDVY